MFAAERYLKIKQLLLEYKHMDVATLTSILSVSAVTVRKDLEKLSKEGFLTKTHGGVMLVQEPEMDEYVSNILKEELTSDDEEIGLLAARLINDNEIVFLGRGSASLSVAKNIKTKNNLTIVTNNQDIVSEISSVNNIRVIAVGGEVVTYKNSIMTQGNIALASMQNYNFNKSFLCMEGITIEEGYTVYNEFEAVFYDAVIDKTKDTYVVADHDKFGNIGLYNYGSLDKIKNIISNSDLDDKYKKYLGENGFAVYTTFAKL